eukprot:TRINITY_DN12183_c0_g1_i4.p1 TRINITY_DN12183_c0_g1~~TRINITY_DN12183_c0_g1_i4.p1  ORF type:complete len:821 (+),score=117.38 TRINITY_DN12183_c0_g1_i4:55-2463(+)
MSPFVQLTLTFVFCLLNFVYSKTFDVNNSLIVSCATQQVSRVNIYEGNTVADYSLQDRVTLNGVLFEDVPSNLLQKCSPEKKLAVEVCTTVLNEVVQVCVGQKEITFQGWGNTASEPIQENDSISICQMTYNQQTIDVIRIQIKRNKNQQKLYLFNHVTACIGQFEVGVKSPISPLFPLMDGALTIGTDVSTLKRVGMPIKMNVAIKSIQEDISGSNLLLHPCVEGVGEGYTPGLNARFFSPYIQQPGSVTYGDEFFLLPDDFQQENMSRCDCPDHLETSGPFIGRPPLNNDTFSSNFVVNMVGEVFVRNTSDVIVPKSILEQNFPYESIKLVCLQHDDTALLEMNSVLYYLQGTTNQWTNSKVSCWEILMLEGWHSIMIWYASVPMDQRHLLQLHIFDPIAIQETQSGRYVIQWMQNGRPCVGSNSAACVPAYSCCNYRSTNCSSENHPQPTFSCEANNFICLAGSQGVSTRESIPVACLGEEQEVPATTTIQFALDFVDSEGNSVDYISCLPASGIFDVNNPPSLTCTVNGQSLSIGESLVTINFIDTQGAVFNTVLVKLITYGRVLTDILQVNEDANTSNSVEVLSQSFVEYIPETVKKNEEGQVVLSLVPQISVDGVVGGTVFELETQGTFTVANILSIVEPSGDLSQPESSLELSAIWTIQMQTQQGTDTCGIIRTEDTESVCKNAQCRFYAVDMAFCGTEGLVTDVNSAVILLVCSHLTEVCGDCVLVEGPEQGVVRNFAQVSNSTNAFRMVVEWEEDYKGKVVVDLQRNRNNPALIEECGLMVFQMAHQSRTVIC